MKVILKEFHSFNGSSTKIVEVCTRNYSFAVRIETYYQEFDDPPPKAPIVIPREGSAREAVFTLIKEGDHTPMEIACGCSFPKLRLPDPIDEDEAHYYQTLISAIKAEKYDVVEEYNISLMKKY